MSAHGNPILDTGPAAAGGPSPAPARSAGATVRRLVHSSGVQASVTLVAFLVLMAIYGLWLGSSFLSVDPRLLDIHQNGPILLLGLAVMVTLVAGQFDLSVASMATLTTFLSIGLEVKSGWPFGLVLIACLAVGIAGGLINAFLVERLGVNAFIATLGTGGFFVGASNVYSQGTQISPAPGHNLPAWFVKFGQFDHRPPAALMWVAVALAAFALYRALARAVPESGGVQRSRAIRAGVVGVVIVLLVVALDLPKIVRDSSWIVATVLIVGVALYLLLEMTSFGRNLRATGANREAARLAGVRTQAHVVTAFVLGSVLAALAGVVLGASQGAAAPDVAATFLLPAFAAAFLSTVVLSTGRFTVPGTILGGIFVVWVSQGLIIGGVSPQWTDIVNGAVLVSAVALSAAMRRARS